MAKKKQKSELSVLPKKLRIKVLGGGYIGKKIAKYLDAELDTRMVYTVQDAQEMMYVHHDNDWLKFDWVINAIGKTGTPNVDWCDVPENQRETFMSNVLVPMHIAEAAKREGVKMLHISSGCIYDGAGPFTEEDPPNFEKSFYSFTKKTAERVIEQYKDVLTVRIRMPITADTSERNLITKLLKYEKIIDTPNSVTTEVELLAAIKALIDADARGIYNVVSPRPITHKRILEIYDEVKGTQNVKEKTFIKPEDLVVATPRTNTVLSSEKLAKIIPQMETEAAVRYEIEVMEKDG